MNDIELYSSKIDELVIFKLVKLSTLLLAVFINIEIVLVYV